MAFHEVQFPVAVSFGSVGGPERRTDIVTLANGQEERNSPWAQSRRRYDAGIGLRSLDDVAAVVAFFEARHGRLHAFRWKDWADYKSCLPSRETDYRDQVIARGDGATRTFQLVKVYRSGAQSYARPIVKPVAGSVTCGVQDVAQTEGAHFTLDPATGLVTFAEPPLLDAEITAGFEFDVPARFDTDHIAASVATFRAGEVPSVPVIEVSA